MSNLFNSNTGSVLFTWDRCCHLLLSHHIARLPECSGLISGKPCDGQCSAWAQVSFPCLLQVTGNTYSEKSEKTLLTHRWDQVYVDPFKFLNIIRSSNQVLRQHRHNYSCSINSKGWTFQQLPKNPFSYSLIISFLQLLPMNLFDSYHWGSLILLMCFCRFHIFFQRKKGI